MPKGFKFVSALNALIALLAGSATACSSATGLISSSTPTALRTAAHTTAAPLRYQAVRIAKPASADSLAGVIARLCGADSGKVAGLAWRQSPLGTLERVLARTYAYRGQAYDTGDLWATVGTIAQSDVKEWSITFAARKYMPYYPGGPTPVDGTYADDAETVKHELMHVLTADMGHPQKLFQVVEAYRGR